MQINKLNKNNNINYNIQLSSANPEVRGTAELN